MCPLNCGSQIVLTLKPNPNPSKQLLNTKKHWKKSLTLYIGNRDKTFLTCYYASWYNQY